MQNNQNNQQPGEKPFIGITMGDPAGIGPEIVLKALSNPYVYEYCKPLVIGNVEILNMYSNTIADSKLHINIVEKPSLGKYKHGYLDLLNISAQETEGFSSGRLIPGQIQAAAGRAAYNYIEAGCKLALQGDIAALVTAPINKESLRAAKIDTIGHTELLASLTKTENPLTMFQVKELRVFFLSRHLSLRGACDFITIDNVYEGIERCMISMKQLGLDSGVLAVAGLNPHNGEHGLFGDEEVKSIEPAIIKAREAGFKCVGPVPADSVFTQALKGKYAAVLSLYHDQGHIATKTLDFERTISVTLGLPFLRTSVDHGTAFDIAGKGIASEVSMLEAIKVTKEYLK